MTLAIVLAAILISLGIITIFSTITWLLDSNEDEYVFTIINSGDHITYEVHYNRKNIGYLKLLRSDKPYLILEELYVVPEHRGYGVAVMLMEKMMDNYAYATDLVVKAEPYEKEEFPANNTGLTQDSLTRFYESFGFVPFTSEDVLIREKDLTYRAK